MSEIIHLLPDSIANQIAAGEVIQRPASMLKELVENAIDAHATQITIELQDAGKELMRVIDDGVGMSPLDARMAFERHATSKISSVDDLFTLRSMGFRGEALASIVAVAQIELVTRQADSDIGYKLLINGSEVISSSPTVAEVGTSITVKNLFYNVPARRRFLKGSETELRHIYRQFERIALVYPEIAFTLYSEGKLIRNLPKSDLQHRIVDLLGKSYSKQLIPIEYQGPLANVSGFITLPRDAKRRGAQQFFFVNGRYMKHPYFHRAVMNVFEDLVAPGSQPNYFIYFQVDPSRIDVNIHPTKTEIKFLDEQAIFKLLMVVLREHLSTTSAMPAITFSTDQLIEIPAYDATRQSDTTLQPPPVQIDPEYNPFKLISTDDEQPLDPLSPVSSDSPAHWESFIDDFRQRRGESTLPASQHTGAASTAEDPLFMVSASSPQTAANSNNLVYTFQERYLFTTMSDRLAVIQIERALLRIYYEQQIATLALEPDQAQPLLFAEELSLPSEIYPMHHELVESLRQIGFEITPQEASAGTDTDDNVYLITSVPKPLRPIGVADMITKTLGEYLDQLEREEIDAELSQEVQLAQLFLSSEALRQASELVRHTLHARATQPSQIISDLFLTPNSQFDPLGRSIMVSLTSEEIDKWF